MDLRFDSLEEEVRFLRALVAAQRLADEVLEDCVERGLGLAAASDVLLSQCARLIHAQAAFVEVRGTRGTVLVRTFGSARVEVVRWTEVSGATPLEGGKTMFVAPLTLGKIVLGSIGFQVEGSFPDGGRQVQAVVEAVAETYDSAVLSFLAVGHGQGPLALLDEVAESTDFQPQARLGRYELLRPLGTGGMAQVLVARTLLAGGVTRTVALKRILPRLAREPEVVEQFLDEARLALRLSHPNLPAVYDFGQAGSTWFIAMELIEGLDLERVLHAPGGPLPVAFTSGVLVQALAGLHAAHEATGDDGLPLGLVHRDLSPQNLMVGFDGRVRVLDFGVAKVRDRRTVTLPGVVKGKPLFMSPEQACAQLVDRRADLFAAGLILHHAVVGTHAFDRGEQELTMEATVVEPLQRAAAVDDALWSVIERALAKRPEERFQDAREMAAALARAVPPMDERGIAALVASRAGRDEAVPPELDLGQF